MNVRQWKEFRLETKKERSRERKRVYTHTHTHTHAPTPSQKPGVYVDKHTALPIPM